MIFLATETDMNNKGDGKNQKVVDQGNMPLCRSLKVILVSVFKKSLK